MPSSGSSSPIITSYHRHESALPTRKPWNASVNITLKFLHVSNTVASPAQPQCTQRKRKKNELRSEKLKSSPPVNCGGHLRIRPLAPSSLSRQEPQTACGPREGPHWQGQVISSPVKKKMDFLSFHCGWKCNISVCNFNFTADWHLQRQRILIKLQKHLIQWLADGERVGSSSIFLTMLTKHGVCFPNAPTLFFIYDLNSVMKNRD